jgi:hypothetical protein
VVSPSPFGATTGIRVRRAGSENSLFDHPRSLFSDAHEALAYFLDNLEVSLAFLAYEW